MVTGDALAIAKETAKTLGMGTNILDAKMLGDSKKQESAEVIESIEKADGFAEVFPEHKFHIVDVLQKRDHIVGMTGDGVNDAPALKKADCGIAVSSATDAARAAAAIVLLTPGLSVIIDAIKESRRIFQRMNSYAIYRIAETLRVLLFMTLAILVFNFYPLTAVMIVMLALLNDGAILSIAYDNVHYKDKPESWNMRMVLGVSTVLGVIGVVSAFGLFYLGERVFHLDRPHIQTLMYLKLSVAGHLTIFLTRTRGAFWSIRPAKILMIAVFGTQAVATLIAVYGLFMTPLGWGWAGFVWGYALLWFLVNDRIKLLAYRIFDPVKVNAQTETKGVPQPDAKVETKSDSKAEAKPEEKVAPAPEASSEAKPKTETKPDVNSTPDTKAKTVTDLTPQIAARAYELYEHQGHRDGQSAQNWDKAEQEIRETQAKAEPKAESKPAAKDDSQPETKGELKPGTNSKPDAKVEPTPAAKVEPKPETKSAEPQPEAKAEPKADIKNDTKPTGAVGPKPDANVETKSETNGKPAAEASPQLVKRVHEFYEQLGREDVRAVEESDQTKQRTLEVETKK
jgi:H+-transporting ATPase